MGSDNKRISKRAPVVLRIKLRYTSVDSFVQKFATNLSPGGMFISSRAPKPIGTTVKFELRLADESAVINGSGIVRWTQEYDPEHPRRLFGMGIEFTQLSHESRAIIERIVEHKRSLGLPDDDEIPMTNRRDPQPAPPSEEPPASPPRPRRRAVSVDELIARAAPPPSASEDDLLSAVDAELPNLSSTLARARQLAGGISDGGELDALLKVTASPVARSVDDASSALASILGGAGVSARRARRTNGRGESAPAPSRNPRQEDPPPPSTKPPSDRDAELEATADDLIAGLDDRPDPTPISSEDRGGAPTESQGPAPSIRTSIEGRRPDLDPAPLPGMPPGAPLLDASSVTDTSSSGSIDLTDLADQLFSQGNADALSHDLDADALDAEALLASGVDRLITPRQRRKSAPIALPDAPDLSSFADPPTMTGNDPMPSAGSPEKTEVEPLDDLDAALAALDVAPAAPPRAPGAPPPLRTSASVSPDLSNDFDADEQPLLTRAEGPPAGMLPPPLPRVRASRAEPVADEETDFDVEIDIEADYDSFEAEPPQEVAPDDPAPGRDASSQREGDAFADDADSDDDDAKKKGIFSRMFGRKK